MDRETRLFQQIINIGFYKPEGQPLQTEDQVLDAPALIKESQALTRYYARFSYIGGSKCVLQDQVRTLGLTIQVF